jgi:hypothetical protein
MLIGTLYLSRHVPVPRRRIYWDVSEDSHNTLVSRTMKRYRSEAPFTYLHVADNDNLPREDKFGKVQQLTSFNKSLIKYAHAEEDISVEESTMPHFGRYWFKQFVRRKPIRSEIKAWAECTRLG